MKLAQRLKVSPAKHIAVYTLRFILVFLLVIVSCLTFLSSPVLAVTSITSYPAPLPAGQVGVLYGATLTANGVTGNCTWAASGLPPGLNFTPSGNTAVISGTPTTANTYPFNITATDSGPPVSSTAFSGSIVINPPAFNVTITIGTGLTAGSTKVYVNSKLITTLKGGESKNLSFDLGAVRAISAELIVAHPTDTGIRFKVKDESITVSEAQPYAQFDYEVEYLVTIQSEPSLSIQSTGSGWYKKDNAVNASTSTEVKGNPGTLYRFAYWLLPGDKKVTTEGLNFTIDSATTIIAKYDTYYKLTPESIYGEVEGGGWYKTGSQARWLVVNDTVPMPGIIGFFQGKYKAVNPSGTETMDAPKTATIFWEPDYLMPYILIPLAILILIAAVVGIYFLLSRQQPRPRPQPFPTVPPYPQYMPQPPPPRPIPQQHTTVVMIGDNKGPTPKQLPQTTKEQLMEKFGELLDKYETEIKSSLPPPGAQALPKVEAPRIEKMIPGPQPTPPPVVDAEFTQSEAEEELCQYTAKKLLRTVTTKWRQAESDTITLPSNDKEETKGINGLSVGWARDIYHEWEIITCTRPLNHKGKHRGDTQVVYSLLNIVIEKKNYVSSEKLQPPTPHFTEGMPELEISDDQIALADELPAETIK